MVFLGSSVARRMHVSVAIGFYGPGAALQRRVFAAICAGDTGNSIFDANCSSHVRHYLRHEIYGNVGKRMKMHENVKKCIKMYENVWKCMEMYEDVCKCMKMYENVWKRMKMYGHVWKRMDMFGNV